MKFLFDLLPIIIFFAVYSLSRNIYFATAVAIGCNILQVVYMLLRRHKIEPLQWISLGLIILFGGATLLAHNPHFIMWKPTVLYWIMALGLIISQWLGKNALRAIIGPHLKLPDSVWRILCFAWALFFLLIGALNLFVAYTFSENTWVNFKLFGVLGLLVVFAIAQSAFLAKYHNEIK